MGIAFLMFQAVIQPTGKQKSKQGNSGERTHPWRRASFEGLKVLEPCAKLYRSAGGRNP